MDNRELMRDRAAHDLGILSLNQQLQDQDRVRVESAYKEVYAQLKYEGIATWAYEGSIPDEVVPYVATLVANNCLNTYAVSDKRYQRIKLEVVNAKREIKFNTTEPQYSEGATNY